MKKQIKFASIFGALCLTIGIIPLFTACNNADKKDNITGVWSLITESEWTMYYGFDKDGTCWICGYSTGYMDDEASIGSGLFITDVKPYKSGKGAVVLDDNRTVSIVEMDNEILPVIHFKGDELKKYQNNLSVRGDIIQMKLDNQIWMLRRDEHKTIAEMKNAPLQK